MGISQESHQKSQDEIPMREQLQNTRPAKSVTTLAPRSGSQRLWILLLTCTVTAVRSPVVVELEFEKE